MKRQLTRRMPALCAAVAMLAWTAAAQVASHAPVAARGTMNNSVTGAQAPKPVARVNGAVLTEIDLQRMMQSMFPYARLHNGVPKNLEPQVRQGALQMIVFEELVYQEAKRRHIDIAPERLARADAAFRKQFPSRAVYEQYLAIEVNGSKAAMREKIRRSLVIEKMLKTEVDQKAVVPLTAVKAYYDNNRKRFEHGETVSIQTISIIPPENASPEVKAEAKAKIKDIVRLARQTKTARDYGLLAEQVSEDDWRTKLGNRGTVDVNTLPPQVASAARALKPGEVSDAIPVDYAWVVIRLNAHAPAGRTPFSQLKKQLLSDLQKQKKEEIRAALNQKLRKDANIEVL